MWGACARACVCVCVCVCVRVYLCVCAYVCARMLTVGGVQQLVLGPQLLADQHVRVVHGVLVRLLRVEVPQAPHVLKTY